MEDLSRRTLRELLTLARERLGSAASGLKTRDELLAALRGGAAPAAVTPPASVVAPALVTPPSVVAPAAQVTVVTRDFFRRRT